MVGGDCDQGHKRRKKALSTVWSFAYAGIFGRREIEEFSATPRNRPCKLLKESRKTLHKEKGLSKEKASKLEFVLYPCSATMCLPLLLAYSVFPGG